MNNSRVTTWIALMEEEEGGWVFIPEQNRFICNFLRRQSLYQRSTSTKQIDDEQRRESY